MRERVPDEATCAICGRHFDPSETRGWCPNPSCGEWQHPSFPVGEETEGSAESTDSGADSSPATPMKQCPNCRNEVRADANFCKHCATQLTGERQPETGDEDEDTEGAIENCPDCGADLSGIPSDRLSTCPICMFDLTPVIEGDGDTHSRTDQGTGVPTDCPNCGEDLTQIPADRRTVCPGCRVDLEEGVDAGADPESRSGPATTGGQPEQTGSNQSGHSRAGDAESTPLKSMDIAGGYVQRLSEIGVTTAGELVASDPDTVSAKTGISAQRIRGWIDDAPVDPDDDRATGDSGIGDIAGTDGESAESDHGQSGSTGSDGIDYQSTRIQRSPDELVFDVMGEEITVTDGTTVGREVRNAMVEAGASEEDAVYVHRKHVRINADEEGFLLTRLGENSLTVNGRPVEKGSQVRIEDGDEVGFSDVVTATVSVR